MSVGGAYWICAWMGITDRRTGGRIGAQWQGLHGMQSGLGYLSFAPKKTIAAPACIPARRSAILQLCGLKLTWKDPRHRGPGRPRAAWR